MTRENAIETIEYLYPADSDYPDTRKIGIQLLEQAKRDADNWRNLPDATLIRYAELCQQKERGLTPSKE